MSNTRTLPEPRWQVRSTATDGAVIACWTEEGARALCGRLSIFPGSHVVDPPEDDPDRTADHANA